MATCNCPTITFPNGGEIIIDRSINVTWYAPTPHHPDDIAVWYELFFTDNYDSDRKIEWVQIGSFPAQIESFNWTIPLGVRSKKCRFAISCRDAVGLRGGLEVIPDNFEIGGRAISQPLILTPISGATYRRAVPITFDHDSISGTLSQRSSYQVYYSSKAQGIDWTVVRESVPFGAEPFLFDANSLQPSNDYEFKFTLTDENGRSSVPVIVSDVAILSLNYVYLDTEPPKGTVKIQPSKQYTKDRDLIVRLEAFDEITDVESVNMRQLADGSVENQNEQKFAEVQTFHLLGEDGLKVVEAQFRDTAGNVLDPNITFGKRTLRPFLDNNDQNITGFVVCLLYTSDAADE